MAQPAASGDAPQTGLIDIHCHLLPGVDDGCRDEAESILCARRLTEAGYTHAICTPHIHADKPHNNVTQIPTAVARLQAALDRENVPLVLLPGGEVGLTPMTIETPLEDLPTIAMAGQYMLFDTWERDWPGFLEPTLAWLMRHKITPVMAHPERCDFVIADPLNVADRLSEMGVLLQLNAYVLADKNADSPRRKAAERLIEFDYYSFLASDLHRGDGMDLRLAGLDKARSLMGQEMFHRLASRNPSQLLPAVEE